MKIKTTLLISWVVVLIVSIYASFKTKVQIKLWSWFGYNVGLANIYSNMPIKITMLILVPITFYVFSKNDENENEIINYPLKYVKKKKQKLTQVKQTIKV